MTNMQKEENEPIITTDTISPKQFKALLHTTPKDFKKEHKSGFIGEKMTGTQFLAYFTNFDTTSYALYDAITNVGGSRNAEKIEDARLILKKRIIALTKNKPDSQKNILEDLEYLMNEVKESHVEIRNPNDIELIETFKQHFITTIVSHAASIANKNKPKVEKKPSSPTVHFTLTPKICKEIVRETEHAIKTSPYLAAFKPKTATKKVSTIATKEIKEKPVTLSDFEYVALMQNSNENFFITPNKLFSLLKIPAAKKCDLKGNETKVNTTIKNSEGLEVNFSPKFGTDSPHMQFYTHFIEKHNLESEHKTPAVTKEYKAMLASLVSTFISENYPVATKQTKKTRDVVEDDVSDGKRSDDDDGDDGDRGDGYKSDDVSEGDDNGERSDDDIDASSSRMVVEEISIIKGKKRSAK